MAQGYNIFCDGITVEYFTECGCFEKTNTDHCHDRYELLFVSSGTGTYIVEGVEHFVSPGAALIINPFTYHNVAFSNDEDFSVHSIWFSKSSLPQRSVAMLELIIGDEGNGSFFASNDLSEYLRAVMERFFIAKKLSRDEREIFCESIISCAIALLSEMRGKRISSPDVGLGARVLRYLNNNIEDNISLDKLARRFFVSKYHLCRAFKEYSGISVHSYINCKRIMYAKQLIEQGSTASAAAEKVGFGDYSAFYRAYVRIVGKSPTFS